MAYRYVKRPGHPLAPKSGQLPLHRVVLYDKIGPGPHPCHGCGAEVNWSSARTGQGALIADHLDGDKTNNDPSNLAPSCHPCNTRRAYDAALGDCYITLPSGHRKKAVERTCGACQGVFKVIEAKVKHRPDWGKYCSIDCVRSVNPQLADAMERSH